MCKKYTVSSSFIHNFELRIQLGALTPDRELFNKEQVELLISKYIASSQVEKEIKKKEIAKTFTYKLGFKKAIAAYETAANRKIIIFCEPELSDYLNDFSCFIRKTPHVEVLFDYSPAWNSELGWCYDAIDAINEQSVVYHVNKE